MHSHRATKDVDPFTMATARNIGLLLPCIPYTIYKKYHPFPKAFRWKLLIRAFLGSTNLLIQYYGYKHMPIADVNMIAATAPAFTVVFAYFLLDEPIRSLDVFNLVLVLGGIALIVQPSFIFGYVESYVADSEYAYATASVFVGAILFQANIFIILKMLKEVPAIVVLLTFGIFGAAESLLCAVVLGSPHLPSDGADLAMMLTIGLVSFVAQMGLTLASQLETAGTVGMLRKAFDMIFAFLLQSVIFTELPSLLGLLGALMIVLAVALAALSKLMGDKGFFWTKKKVEPEAKMESQ